MSEAPRYWTIYAINWTGDNHDELVHLGEGFAQLDVDSVLQETKIGEWLVMCYRKNESQLVRRNREQLYALLNTVHCGDEIP